MILGRRPLPLLIPTALAVVGAAAQAQTPPALPASTLPMQLVAVMLDKEAPTRSSCLIRCAYPVEKQGRFAVGQTACEFAEIKDIREQDVLVTNLLRNRVEVLPLAHAERQGNHPSAAASESLPPPPPPPVITESADGASVDLAKGAVEHYLGNLPEVLASALAAPRFRDGPNGVKAVDGYEIGGVKETGVAEQLGLRNGDVLLEVNGQPLDGLPTILRLLGEVQTMPQVKLTVLRKNQKVTLVFRTK